MLVKPALKLNHLYNMTDCTGIIQHSKYSIPDLATGYTTDDNARALIIASMLYDKYSDDSYLTLMSRYLSFLHFAQNQDGRFKNFMNYQRHFIENVGSEDSFGRSLWALSFLSSLENIPNGLLEPANQMIRNAIPCVSSLKAVRSICYSIIGLTFIYKKNNKMVTRKLIESLAESVVNSFLCNKTDNWYWYENKLTYANGIVPYSLFRAYSILGKKKYLKTGIDILSFLESILLKDGYLKLIGCNGWAVRGKMPAKFDEQPIDAADMVLAYAEVYKLTNNIEYLKKAETCFKWFLGLNCHDTPLLNIETGGCFDGLTKTGLNMNQGAESVFSYIVSYLTAEELGIANPDIRTEKDETLEEAV